MENADAFLDFVGMIAVDVSSPFSLLFLCDDLFNLCVYTVVNVS